MAGSAAPSTLRVLLLGEYSGVHRNLATGLRSLGVHVDVASAGDAWKRIDGDISFDLGRTGAVGAVLRNVVPYLRLPRIRSYDVIQVVNPQLLTTRYGWNALFFEALLAKLRSRVFLLACGCDVATNRYFQSAHPFPQICSECKRYDQPGHQCIYENPREVAFEARLLERVDGVIPTGVEYLTAYETRAPGKLRPWIPLPFALEGAEYRPNVRSDGVVRVFHGLNRDGFKGTRHVRAAFERAASRVGRRAEFHVFGRMPLREYLARTEPMNVVVDQLHGVSYGMNALFQLARGKVVVGGGSPEHLARCGIRECPIKFTGDSVDVLVDTIVSLVGLEALETEGARGRRFVEELHDARKVAARFLAEWTR